MTKQIIYKEIIVIDEQEYILSSYDYSDSVNEWIQDSILEDNNREIINHIIDHIVNLQ